MIKVWVPFFSNFLLWTKWMVCPTQNSCVETLTLQRDDTWSWGFMGGLDEVIRVGLMMHLVSLWAEKTPELSFSLKAMWEHGRGQLFANQEKGSHQEPNMPAS